MSIAAQCPDCCTCPAPVIEWESRSASLTKCGNCVPAPSGACISNKRYFTTTISGYTERYNTGATCDDRTLSTRLVYSGYCTTTFAGTAIGSLCGFYSVNTEQRELFNGDGSSAGVTPMSCGGYATSGTTSIPASTRNETQYYFEGEFCRLPGLNVVDVSNTKTDLSDEYTTALLKANTAAALPAWDNDWNDTTGSFANLSPDELTFSARESRYRFRFAISKVGSGLCYRLTWVERFIAEAGVGVDAIEVFARGVYRPTVTVTGGGGTGCLLVAVMSSTGTVTGVRVLNPGTGYTTAPTISVQAAISGGTTSTGWTATVSGGQVTAVAGGSAGNYRPTLTISAPGGGGATATATCTLDSTGGIDAVAIGTAGTLYTATPTVTITPKVSGSTAAVLGLHLGTETAMCAAWDGVTPGGYDPATPSTYPILGDGTNPYFSLPVPAVDGLSTVELIRAFCDCSECP